MNSINESVKSEIPDQDNRCHTCGKEFSNFDLEVHYLTCKREEENGDTKERIVSNFKRFKCEKCGISFLTKRGLDYHNDESNLRKCLGQVMVSPFSCKICNKVFKSENQLSTHLGNVHRAKFKCDNCGRCFQQKRSLDYHNDSSNTQKCKASIMENLHKCEVLGCNKAFKNTLHLQNHSYKAHGTQTIRCNTCGQIVKTQCHHYLSEGIGKCQECEKVELNKHMLTCVGPTKKESPKKNYI